MKDRDEGVVPVPQYQKPEGATAEDPEGKRFAKDKRKEAFLDRLYGGPATQSGEHDERR